MATKRDNIYGTDENGFAEGIASAALGRADSDRHSGSPDDGEPSVGSKGKRLDGTEEKTPIAKEPNPEVKTMGNKNDSRAGTKGNHGEQG